MYVFIILKYVILVIGEIFQLAPKLEALREEYMRFGVEKCGSVLREYRSAVETIAGRPSCLCFVLFCSKSLELFSWHLIFHSVFRNFA